MLLLKAYNKLSFEVARKMYHLVITLSIIPLLELFSSWYIAVLVALMFIVVVYPILTGLENSSFFKRIEVERDPGEFKRSLVIVQLTFATLIFVFWGLLGENWKYIVLVATLTWGFGDAAAALVGKAVGRNHIRNPRIEGTKTVEGTLAMYVVAALTIFMTLLIGAHQPWYVSAIVAVLVGLVGAVVELFSHRGMDTMTVPFAVGFSVLLLMSFFSFLGV